MRGQDQMSRVLYELSALVLSILRSPPQLPGSYPPEAFPAPVLAPPARRPQVSPAGMASLLLGISLALMLCGSVTFVIGFMLMPWVLGFVMMVSFIGMVSSLSGFGRSILCPPPVSPVGSPRKEIPGQFFSKLPLI